MESLLKTKPKFKKKFQDVFTKYEYYQKIENLISYIKFISSIFYTESEFKESSLFNCLKRVQKQGRSIPELRTNRRNSKENEYRRVIQSLVQKEDRFVFIEELSIKFKG